MNFGSACKRMAHLVAAVTFFIHMDSDLQASPLVPITDVVIDVGHGGVDPGTAHEKILEKDINLAVAKKLYTMLDDRGYRVVMNRLGDYALSEENGWLKHPSRHLKDLRQRNELSKALNPRAVVSLHVNWSSNSEKSGPIVIRQKNEYSTRLADLIQNELNTFYGSSHKSHIGKTYYLLNRGPQPSVIVEMGFISHPSDRGKLTDPKGQNGLAEAIADGISQYLREPAVPVSGKMP